ncbi:hypothetical protein [uncultured Hyphomicrobium sp.]|uniref:hypothetical protein n=1 Tax=uncultured Hyphomicrobium sp. TaxID=194373 RepID=UPI0025FE684E|nr:hypothetical protein [uncultured Hyphomicrobium sp.]
MSILVHFGPMIDTRLLLAEPELLPPEENGAMVGIELLRDADDVLVGLQGKLQTQTRARVKAEAGRRSVVPAVLNQLA